jgi:membrane protease YdiL (CAAX protease family)
MTASPAPPDESFLSAPELPAGVEPRRPPPWRPWSSVAALITGFAGALVGAAIIGGIAAALGADFEDPPPVVSILGTIWQDLCLIGAALLFARLTGPRPRPSHFGLRPTRIGRAIGLVALTWASFWVFTGVFVTVLGLDPQDDQLPQELGVDESALAMVSVAFLVCVVAPVAEEFFFRGYFFTALRNWRGKWLAAVLTGLVFGGIHAGSSDPAFLVPLAFFGFALCVLYDRTGSLYPCIALHSLNNSVAFGASQDWTWEIAVLVGGALGLTALIALAVQRLWAPRAPAPATAPAT